MQSRDPISPCLLLIVACTSLCGGYVALAEQPATAAEIQPDSYSILAVPWDLPPKFEERFTVFDKRRPSSTQTFEIIPAVSDGPMLRRSHVKNGETIVKIAPYPDAMFDITIERTPNAKAALELFDAKRTSPGNSGITEFGSYSGQPLGDRCIRGVVTDTSSMGSVAFVYKSIYLSVSMHGRPGTHGDAGDECEAASLALIARIDAAMDFEQRREEPILVLDRTLTKRSPRGVSVVDTAEFAAATLIKTSFDPDSATVQVQNARHVLILHVGRREAFLDRKPITLPFPALRRGEMRVWCPVDTLKRLLQ